MRRLAHAALALVGVLGVVVAGFGAALYAAEGRGERARQGSSDIGP